MIRMLALAAIAGLASAFGAEPIDLDVPGNLEAIQRDRPAHYAKIQKILAEAPLRAWNAKSVAQWMEIDFDARDVRSSDLMMTSLPPKRRLEFTLDGVSYSKLVTLQSNAAPLQARPDGKKLEGREAISAYRAAARAGDCNSAARLGEIYRDGEGGIPRDQVEAEKWFNAARVLGCDAPTQRSRGRTP